jgi:hypothetical protein
MNDVFNVSEFLNVYNDNKPFQIWEKMFNTKNTKKSLQLER